jgi:hypothetical protein
MRYNLPQTNYVKMVSKMIKGLMVQYGNAAYKGMLLVERMMIVMKLGRRWGAGS